MKHLEGSLTERIKKTILSVLPEEKKNFIPCVAFGAALLVLGGLNLWKWVIR